VDQTIPYSYLGTNNPEAQLYNINRIINNTDISNIDYTTGGTNGHELVPLCDMFSDNIILYYFIPEEIIERHKICRNLFLSEEELTDAEPTISNNEIGKGMLPIYTAKIQLLFNTFNLPISKGDIKPTNILKLTLGDKTKLKQCIKVSLANCKYETIIKVLNSKECIELLAKDGLFINDVDFTQDFAGLFNKTKLIEHLLQQPGYRFQKSWNFTDEAITILDNADKVSNNCLAFIRTTTQGTARYKFYNKFIQSMESPSVRNKVGSHIIDWCNNPEEVLKQSISKSLDTGLLRLEITFYRNNTEEQLAIFVTEEHIKEQMEWLKQQITPEQIYYNPISTQWTLLAQNINYNMCIVNLDSNEALLSFYVNKTTEKTNAGYINNVDENKLSLALKLYTYNVLIIALLYRETYKKTKEEFIWDYMDSNSKKLKKYLAETKTLSPHNQRVRIEGMLKEDQKFEKLYQKECRLLEFQQTTYIKTSDETILTYLTNGSKKLSVPEKYKGEQPQARGLIDLDNAKLRILDKNIGLRSKNKKAESIPIKFTTLDFPLINFPEETFRQLKKKIKEQVKDDNFAKEQEQQIVALQEENRKIKELAEEVQERIKLEKYVDSFLKVVPKVTKKFTDFQNKTEFSIFAVKNLETKYGDTNVLYFTTQPSLDFDTSLQSVWSTGYINEFIKKRNFQRLNVERCIGTYTVEPIFVLRKVGEYYNASRNKCADVKILATKHGEEEVIDKSNLLVELPASVKIKDCNKLDDLVKEGETITVIAYRKSGKSLLIQIREKDGYFITGYYLKELLAELGIDKPIVIALAGIFKTTPKKIKARTWSV
jgi:hypothetical protein